MAHRSERSRLHNEHLSWAKDETHTDDPESFLPFERLDEAVAAGRVGSVSDRFSCLPTHFGQRRTVERDTPQVREWLGQDEVDVALLVPF